MELKSVISEILRLPKDAITYAMGETLKKIRPGKAMIHGDDGKFDVESYAKAGLCELRGRDGVFNDVTTDWQDEEHPIVESIKHGWYEVAWQGHSFELVWTSISGSFCTERYFWLMGSSLERIEVFFAEVCRWNTRVPEVVWIFDGGHWRRSAQLYQSIKDATFERLILPGDLCDELKSDFKQFIESRETYARYRVPWKRGVLLIGPPGNGKTYTVKALINWLGVTCLYVKSFKSQHGTEHGCIRTAFDYARQITPCILVLEDLDSLIDDENRSYFLNEMDGFMSNDGISVVATTNHPDRLDTAIVDRPSRFDRKYHFELPDASLRERYMSGWNETAAPELRLTPAALAAIVGDTDGFSFAYLKELWLSSMMRWINTIGLSRADSGEMDQVMAAQLAILREQMTAARDVAPPGVSDVPADFAQHYATYVRQAIKRGLGSVRSLDIAFPSESIPDDDAEED